MSVFTRLYYANRALRSHGGDDAFDRPDHAFHHSPALGAAPDDPYRIPDQALNLDLRGPGHDMRRPQAGSWQPRDATSVRLPG